MSTAVLYELSSEARNSARSAISCGRPKRPSNDLCENVARPFRTTELPSRVPSLSGPARRCGTVDRPRGHWRLSVGGARKPLCHDRRPHRVAATAVSRRRTASSSDHRDPARTTHLVRDEIGGPEQGPRGRPCPYLEVDGDEWDSSRMEPRPRSRAHAVRVRRQGELGVQTLR